MHITVNIKKFHQIMSDGSIITTLPEDPIQPASLRNMSTQVFTSKSINDAYIMQPQYVSDMKFFDKLWYKTKKTYKYILEYIKRIINNCIQKIRRNK